MPVCSTSLQGNTTRGDPIICANIRNLKGSHFTSWKMPMWLSEQQWILEHKKLPQKSGLCHCSGLLLWVTGKLAWTEPGLRLLWHGLFQYMSQSPIGKKNCLPIHSSSKSTFYINLAWTIMIFIVIATESNTIHRIIMDNLSINYSIYSQ